ncbi:MAG: NADH:ubiquinone oxidoreductase [Candidatus Latescibacterota bacterium]|nr:MAG: NADH:ubiquinone oxidoreductase [Candidatus Latescibacterota bacterium]
MSIFTKALKKSIWVYHVAASPCNNCDIEILDLLTPRFDVERFGILLVGSPRHADALLITGYVNRQVAPRVIEVYKQTPKPCVVFAVGACACSMGIFAKSYNAAGPLDKLIRSVDPNALIVYVPGCPPKPEAIISAVVKAISAL